MATEVLTGEAPQRSRWWAIAQGLLTLVLVGLLFGVAIPNFGSYADIWAAITKLTWVAFAALIALTLAMEMMKAMAAAVLIGPLSLRRAYVVQATASLVSHTIPGPSGMAMRRQAYRRYGLSPADTSRPMLVNSLWNSAVLMLLPSIAITLLAFQDSIPSRVLWLTLIGLVGTLLGLGLITFVMRREDTAYRAGAIANRAVKWGLEVVKRPGSVDVGTGVVRLRTDALSVVRRHWGRLTAVVVAKELTVFLILLVALRSVSAERGLLMPIEIFAVYAIVHLATIVQITPGGIGVTETLYISALLYASQGAAENEIVAGVFVFRLFSYLGPILIGLVCWPILARHLGRTANARRTKSVESGGAA
ncbi:hypothetical protein G5C51_01770 [Streptomyces sp. A7024]|uniref:Flippase-like domain-containing protein n=1 Tax=Streptomyces coryli TaxID=1128680 RepID=A0A6G4TS64_9ACTN|nr:YbhN family protein [Streptomyces coryli]NGN62633.1 hypothetical protein [Streptomyces coryli]